MDLWVVETKGEAVYCNDCFEELTENDKEQSHRLQDLDALFEDEKCPGCSRVLAELIF